MTSETARKPWHALPPESVLRALGSNRETGLSAEGERARRVPRPWPRIIWEQVSSPRVLLLFVAAGFPALSLGEFVSCLVLSSVVLWVAEVGKLRARRKATRGSPEEPCHS